MEEYKKLIEYLKYKDTANDRYDDEFVVPEQKLSRMFRGLIISTSNENLTEGRSFFTQIGKAKYTATIMNIKFKVDPDTGDRGPAGGLSKNDIAECDIVLSDDQTFDKTNSQASFGEFILTDRENGQKSALGVVLYPLRRSENVIRQELDITREQRAGKMSQKPVTLWFTGLSGAGKSTLANEVEKKLFMQGRYTMLLDGDNIRMGINKNLGFEQKDRIENIRRVAEVSKLMNDAGLIVLTSFISPYRSDRRNAKDIIGSDNFVEIYVSTSLTECERRDVKGLYKKARAGKIPNFTGIGSPYEPPEDPQITIDTGDCDIDEAVEYLMSELEKFM